MGACHASSAILFILLREQGYEAVPCIGEVSKQPIVFDHSWIEINGNIIDAATSNSLIPEINLSPILLGI